MAHERKASDSASPGSRGHRSPIPQGKKDDLEDVSWALSTAEAMWGRGDHADALKWLRRAAESAAEAEADDRALELAKAAADVASLLAQSKPPAHAHPPSAIPMAPPTPLITTTTPSRPPPPLPIQALSRPAASPPSGAPTPPRVGTTASPLPRPGQKGPTPPRVMQPAPVSKRGGRKSSPSIHDEPPAPRSNRVSSTNEAKKRNRASKPSPEETAPLPVATAAITANHPAVSAEPDVWPSPGLDDDDDDQHTRIGTPAYTESAQKASARPPPMSTPPSVVTAPQPAPPTAAPVPGSARPAANALPMRSSQAVRVVVWRAADGVHIAPAGTTVSAIAVEALLVALDPAADLANWLTNK